MISAGTHTEPKKDSCRGHSSLSYQEGKVRIILLDCFIIRLEEFAKISFSTYRAPALPAPTGERCKRISLTADGSALDKTELMIQWREASDRFPNGAMCHHVLLNLWQVKFLANSFELR